MMTVTADNLAMARQVVAQQAWDQAIELVPGCVTWTISYGGGMTGRITVWPEGRGAVAYNGDSAWGEWDEDRGVLLLDYSDVSVGRNGACGIEYSEANE